MLCVLFAEFSVYVYPTNLYTTYCFYLFYAWFQNFCYIRCFTLVQSVKAKSTITYLPLSLHGNTKLSVYEQMYATQD